MADINLSKAVRSNLSSLQNTATLMAKTQDRLSTGNKVNSALDNPTNFFTAASLNSRAGDLNNLMDSMANGIKTIEAADNGLSAITKNLESMQSTLRQARQDKSFQTASYTMPAAGATPAGTEQLTLSGGALTGSNAISLTKTSGTTAAATQAVLTGTTALASIDASAANVTFEINGQAVTLNAAGGTAGVYDAAAIVTAINTQVGTTAAVNATNVGGMLTLTSTGTAGASQSVSVSNAPGALGLSTTSASGSAATTASTVFKTADELVNEINNNAGFTNKIRASNDNGKLRIENMSTQELTVGGVNVSGNVNGTSTGTSAAKIAGNSVRSELASQFNELRDQLDKMSDDASFNGINLLRGDNLKITFNETGTSSIDIQSKGEKAVNATNLKLTTTLTAKDLDSDSGIDGFLDQVKGALNSVRSQASAFGSNLSIVQNRQDFTKSMINTLETGAGNLTLADMNQEAANMMALQTRQSLASSTLSMANQADQGVLQLLR